MATRVRCCGAWEAGRRAAQTPASPRLERLRGGGRSGGACGSGSWPRRPAPVHLYLVSAGRGPTALDVSAVLRAGERRPLQPLRTNCFTRPALLPASSRQDARLTLGTEPLFNAPRMTRKPLPDSTLLGHQCPFPSSLAAPCPSPALSGP